jgi:outer membrane protein TolC
MAGLLVLLTWAGNVSGVLLLSEAERIALQDDPGVAAVQARSEALREASVADGQLPDPKLKVGMFNVPLDSFDVDEEPTTQLRLGLQQAFPRGHTLRFKQKQSEWQAAAEDARGVDTANRTTRSVREDFLELYYQVRARQIILETRGLFTQLVEITQAHYASGRVRQQDVLRADLELSRLDDRATRIRNLEDVSRAALSRWIGTMASQPVDAEFPVLPELPEQPVILANLTGHPLIDADTAWVESNNQAVQIAREQYKPGWNFGVEYRKRFGEDPTGDDREDMMAAMVTVDLPLFREKRQDRRLAASQQQVQAARYIRDDRFRQLNEIVEREYANWRRLGEREVLYKERLVREATANARASIKAYQSGVTEFTTLMRARITELDVRLNDLRVRVDRAKAQARLLYLASGVEQ